MYVYIAMKSFQNGDVHYANDMQMKLIYPGLCDGVPITPVEEANCLDPLRSHGQDDLELRVLAKKIDALSVDSDGEEEEVAERNRPDSPQNSVDENFNQDLQDEGSYHGNIHTWLYDKRHVRKKWTVGCKGQLKKGKIGRSSLRTSGLDGMRFRSKLIYL